MDYANQGSSRQFEPFSHFAFFFPKSAAICVVVFSQKGITFAARILKRLRRMNRSTFSVLFCVNKGKVKNGTAPVKGRNTINNTAVISLLAEDGLRVLSYRRWQCGNEEFHHLFTERFLKKIPDIKGCYLMWNIVERHEKSEVYDI